MFQPLWFVMILLTACLEASVPITVEPPADLDALGEEARVLAGTHCGSCHGVDGNREALAIFDLRKPKWFASLDDDQLDVAMRRMKGKAEPPELERFRAFIEAAKSAKSAH